MILLKVTIDNYKYTDNLFKRKLKDFIFRRVKKIDVDKLADEVSEHLIDEMIKNLHKEGSIVTYTLAESIIKERLDEGRYVVKVEAPYAPVVEHGRGARGDGTIPNPQQRVDPFAIEDWVKMKFGYSGKFAKDVAFRIVSVLKTEGHYPHPFFEPAIKNTKLWFGMDKERLKKVIIKGESV